MDLPRVADFFNGRPFRVECNTEKGRHLVATEDLKSGQVLLESQAYLAAVLPSWKKRVCHLCSKIHPHRLVTHCRGCGQVYFCGPECLAAHEARDKFLAQARCSSEPAGPGKAGLPPVPHLLLCPVLKQFSRAKCGADEEAVLHMCLEALARQYLERQAQPAPGGAGVEGDLGPAGHLPLSHADLLTLQNHADDFAARDRKDWLKALNFLITAMARASWPGPLPHDAEELLPFVGRMGSNNFGIYMHRGDGETATVGSGDAADSGVPVERPCREELIGRELYITASYFNHSCAPNCMVVRDAGWATVTAQQDVKAGEELTISYIDLELPRSARREALKAGFFFDCNCSRCASELMDGSAKCTYARSTQVNKDKTFEDVYETLKPIGSGAFAKVVLCRHKESKAGFAVKVVPKKREGKHADEADRRAAIVKEIGIMKTLEAHPNAVQLCDVYESPTEFHLVMELCTGGELFDQIIKKKHYSEKEAAERMLSLIDFLVYAHSKGIVHRDLKPENILLSNEHKDARLKIIDFGTSDFCGVDQKLYHKFGTPYYVAPEVLGKAGHNHAVDIWSAGVILYTLLAGYPPFGGKTDAVILNKVKRGFYVFTGVEWAMVSAEAKNCIRCMLVLDPRRRITAAALHEMPWFQKIESLSDKALGTQVMKRLKQFATMSRMKRLALIFLAQTFADKDVLKLKDMFWQIDKDKSGEVDPRELRESLVKAGMTVPPQAEFNKLFRACDVNGSGQIDYVEFVATMMDSDRVARREDIIQRTFEEFDKDKDGFITVDELASVTKAKGVELDILDVQQMIQAHDTNGDGKIDFGEFAAMIRYGSSAAFDTLGVQVPPDGVLPSAASFKTVRSLKGSASFKPSPSIKASS
ncbi:hypothetical protein WJX72_001575 [[Myrmecia] bisecta]|uniref:Uncharacterized protein n=1 Tax=[Myrmecia] bisecta TaxID=41462 RepID=A0AAW1PSD4_9CHLO